MEGAIDHAGACDAVGMRPAIRGIGILLMNLEAVSVQAASTTWHNRSYLKQKPDRLPRIFVPRRRNIVFHDWEPRPDRYV
jgi:hypothetical protein